MRKKVKSFFMTFIIFTLFPAIANAGIALGGTRLIYDAREKSAAIDVLNTEQQIYLIQAWVEGADKTPVPFVLTPPLFKINKKSQRSLRVMKTQSSLPDNKESLFWLSVKAIPLAEKKAGTVELAVKTRIKLIYRPKGLDEPASDISNKLKWSLQQNTLSVANPTPYYISFYSVKLNETILNDVKVIAPFSSVNFTLSGVDLHGVLSWMTINDYGAKSELFSTQI
ncbi:fimbrial biogenesis chaperone [Lelliottia nimipressuralis]|nr:molecular chaperone [Lelliottia nimipressuralis]